MVMADRVQVYRLEMAAPNDISQLQGLVDSGMLKPQEIIAIICKTEGNGEMNDFTRGFATETFKQYLAEQRDEAPEETSRRIALVMSGGCEGVMTPHATVFARSRVRSAGPLSDKRLAIGVAFTRDLAPEEIGRMAQVRLVAQATEEAMQDAGITDPNDVHYVQTKGPHLTSARINDALARGQTVVTTGTLESMRFSNGSCALGIGLALGEIEPDQLSDDVICRRTELHSSVASCSSGVELMNCQVIVIGNAPGSCSDLVAGHAALKDLLDVDGVLAALNSAGLSFAGFPSPEELERVEAVFVKANTKGGEVRGHRTTLLTDLDLSPDTVRAPVNAMVASVIGDPMIYVSAGWNFHQGAVGGGVVAVIARVENNNVPADSAGKIDLG